MENTETTDSFGYWMRRRRKALDLTQATLAARVGCATVTIIKIERDERRPSRELAELLAVHLEISGSERSRFIAVGLGEVAVHRLSITAAPVAAHLNGRSETGARSPQVSRPFLHPLYNLPPQSTPFVGRKHELADIVRRLQDPACRLLTLIGPGGAGKSRLAIQAAQMVSESPAMAFADGVCFVQLATVDSPSSVVAAIAAAMRFAFYSDLAPRQQLLDLLRAKTMLLLLDNFEHLLPATDTPPAFDASIWLLAEILDAAPAVKIVVTSRTAVHLQQAWFHPVDGMALPPRDATDVQSWQEADAVQFFVQCGRRARVGFGVTPDCAGAVRICRLVEGMPLAIELAASWLKTFDCTQIAGEIQSSLELLTTPAINAPARHRSVRAVFDQSWKLLTAAERSVLMRLSILRGFDLEAAQQVAGASAVLLAALIDKSLVRSPVAGRYQMHELLRQFAAEKLAETPAAASETAARHGAYFLEFLQTREAPLKGKDQQRALDEIDADIDNIHAAWLWAVETGAFDKLASAVESCYEFHHVRSRFQEGETLFARAVERLQREQSASTAPDPVLCAVMTGQGVLTVELGQLDAAEKYLREALVAAQTLALAREAARCLTYLGQVAAHTGRRDEADMYWMESLACCERAGDWVEMADVLQKLAEEATYRGDYARAKQLAQKSLEISRPLERADAVANALDKLGYATLYFGELVESERFYREAYAVFQTIGNLLGIALSGGGLAFVASMKGDANREAAYAYTEESLALVTTIGHRFHIATRLTLYQRVAIAYNDYPLAIDCCQKLLAMSELQDISLLAQLALSDLGYAYCQLGDFAEARRCLLDSLDRSKSVPSFPLSMVLVHCSVLRMAEGRRLAGEAATAALGSALSLILFGARQPTLTYEFKQMAARLRAELEAELPPALVAQARARAETLTVADVRNELSTQVTSSTNLYK